MHGYILMKLITDTHYQVHMTLMIFSRARIQRSRSQTTFFENTIFWRRNTNRRFTVENHFASG